MKRTLMRLVGIVAMALAMVGCSQIDTGNVGVQKTFGQVKEQTLPPGFHFTGWASVTEVCAKEIPLQMADLRPQTSDKITLQDLDVDIYVQIDPSQASKIMTKWTGDAQSVKNGDCEAVGLNFVTRQAREAIYDAATKFGSETIHMERAAIAASTVKALQASLDAEAGKGMFFVRSANVRNLVTDPALEANIKAAAQEQFKIKAERNQLETAKIVAERQRVQAQGEADAIRIKAEAVSKQGGAEYVQLQAIAKWNGVLPTTQAGDVTPFLSLK